MQRYDFFLNFANICPSYPEKPMYLRDLCYSRFANGWCNVVLRASLMLLCICGRQGQVLAGFGSEFAYAVGRPEHIAVAFG